MLFDSGASHSFMSASFARSLELELHTLESPVFVDTPVGGRVRLDRVCRGCEFTLEDHLFTFDFILLEMSSFDLILGMARLSSVHAHIDCYCVEFAFSLPVDYSSTFMVTESHKLILLCSIRGSAILSVICLPVFVWMMILLGQQSYLLSSASLQMCFLQSFQD